MSTRDDIATVLDGLPVDLDGEAHTIDAYPALPSTIQPFTAWPVWQSSSWRSACIVEEGWRVIIVLPASSSDAWADTGDALIEPARDVLSKVGAVLRVEPIALAIGDNVQTVPALAFTLNV
jgi:hypothetical protein